jgi:hypothetical protein
VIFKGKDIVGTSSSLTKATKYEVLAELLDFSKALDETIKVVTTRKTHVGNLIKFMTREQEIEAREVVHENN